MLENVEPFVGTFESLQEIQLVVHKGSNFHLKCTQPLHSILGYLHQQQLHRDGNTLHGQCVVSANFLGFTEHLGMCTMYLLFILTPCPNEAADSG